jgi:hypothetical protein
VHSVHPTLLIGPADWQPDRMPAAEFSGRIEMLWQRCPDVTQVLVCGDSRHHAELAYLTNFVPKLEPAVALFARGGEARLFVGGGPNMLGAARPLTFIADVTPLNELTRMRLSDCALIGADYLAAGHRKPVIEACGASATDATGQVWALMRRKSPAEMAAIREGSAILRGAMGAIEGAHHRGAPVTTAVLAGERAANSLGAQDVRTLFSVDGGRTLIPFAGLIARSIDPLQVYVAIRRFNYWVEGFAMFARAPCPVAAQAAALLRTVCAAIKGGTRAGDVARLIEAGAAPYRIYPVTADFANAIGLALEEPPHSDLGEVYAAGEFYSLKVGLTDGTATHAIASAMIAVGTHGCDVLWTTA